MKRRKFIQSSVIASALPLSAVSAGTPNMTLNSDNELYELRTYEMKFGADQNLLVDYLKKVLQPALNRMGVNHFMMFKELGNSEPTNIWVLISYPFVDVYLRSQTLSSDMEYNAAAASYHDLPPDKAVYSRFSSMLLLAFDGLPKMMDPVPGASIFELRTYEGYSEDATQRKINMFNKEEIDLFLKTKLHPVFFGNMIIGPYRPSLTYMLNFKDMAERDANWSSFINSSEWKTMNAKPEYANSVSNIRKLFLKPF
ncbi:MAG: NIPSNAP family containing protein [Bacteroidetes bacterium]|nr:NIPSNAP family containing protein [Bacteroidota bacterium]